jgi:hypothetical protein
VKNNNGQGIAMGEEQHWRNNDRWGIAMGEK